MFGEGLPGLGYDRTRAGGNYNFLGSDGVAVIGFQSMRINKMGVGLDKFIFVQLVYRMA